MNKLLSQIEFAFKNNPIRMWIICFSFILVFAICILDNSIYNKFQWADPLIGDLTFLVSIFVFFNQIRVEWKESLQHRISVYFEYNGKIIMKFENGVIPVGTDLRAWAQQIGAQMGKTRSLEFLPSVEVGEMKIDWDKKIQAYYCLFPITYILTEVPDFSTYKISPSVIADEKERRDAEIDWRRKRTAFLENGNCIEWLASFDDRGKIKIDKNPNE